MKESRAIKAIYWVLGISFASAITLYFVKFRSNSFSSDRADWGVFGDYIGGILNPIVAIMNLFVFIHLTRVIANADESAQSRNLEYQKKLMLAELRHNIYNQIIIELESISTCLLLVDEKTHFKLTGKMTSLGGMFDGMSHLFPLFDNPSSTDPIIKCLGNMSDQLKRIQETNAGNINMEKYRNDLGESIKNFYPLKYTLIKEMQLVML